jgi:GNAT superfamily N-acetyltransferase
MKYTIQSIQEDHFPELIRLFKEFTHFEKLPELMTNSVEKMISEKRFINGCVAISENNEVIGYVTYFDAYYTWSGKSMYMDDLYVQKEYRGFGIGTRLIESVIEKARFGSCKNLRWQVSEWNKPAIAFYRNLGATVDGAELNCDLILD